MRLPTPWASWCVGLSLLDLKNLFQSNFSPSSAGHDGLHGREQQARAAGWQQFTGHGCDGRGGVRRQQVGCGRLPRLQQGLSRPPAMPALVASLIATNAGPSRRSRQFWACRCRCACSSLSSLPALPASQVRPLLSSGCSRGRGLTSAARATRSGVPHRKEDGHPQGAPPLACSPFPSRVHSALLHPPLLQSPPPDPQSLSVCSLCLQVNINEVGGAAKPADDVPDEEGYPWRNKEVSCCFVAAMNEGEGGGRGSRRRGDFLLGIHELQ
jgi:hypothetical protein